MKKILYIFLLLTSFCEAQTYVFNTIDKRTAEPNWEIRNISGTVVFSDSTITITTAFNTHVLKIINSNQFIRQNDKIFMCVNENFKEINLRQRWDCINDKTYSELYYYSDIPNEKYFRFCLKKI